MKLLFENWRKYINEDKENKVSPDQAIADEGGALGFSKWEELTGMSREELEKYVEDNDNIEIHKHGDIIDKQGLSEDINITEDIVVDEGKICAAGIAWAKRTYDKWPSAYASMGASKHCKKKGKKKKKRKKSRRKNESLQEAELDECWSTHERVPGTKKGAKGSCRPKGSAKREGMGIEEGDLKKWRDEKWVQSDGTPCGDAKAQKNPKRCKPAAKWATMSAGEKKADDAKKKEGGKRGKQFVAATKKGKVRGYSENMKITKLELQQIILEELKDVINEIADPSFDPDEWGPGNPRWEWQKSRMPAGLDPLPRKPRYEDLLTKSDKGEGSMAQGQLKRISELANMISEEFDDSTNLEEWVEAKITKAQDYLSSVMNYMRGKADEKAAAEILNTRMGSYSGTVLPGGKKIQENVDKENMPCNKPRRTPNHPTKSHIVKACEGGEEKIIRFGQQGVKTNQTAGQRKAFKSRHGKNIAKGKMSAAYWADKVKWSAKDTKDKDNEKWVKGS